MNAMVTLRFHDENSTDQPLAYAGVANDDDAHQRKCIYIWMFTRKHNKNNITRMTFDVFGIRT